MSGKFNDGLLGGTDCPLEDITYIFFRNEASSSPLVSRFLFSWSSVSLSPGTLRPRAPPSARARTSPQPGAPGLTRARDSCGAPRARRRQRRADCHLQPCQRDSTRCATETVLLGRRSRLAATTAVEAAGGQPCVSRDSQPRRLLLPDARARAPGGRQQENEELGGRKERKAPGGAESSAQPRYQVMLMPKLILLVLGPVFENHIQHGEVRARSHAKLWNN
ncbi:uncharacterized protein [Symphalangus syndactylus]|uniref:uncharacterized protein n=1 Tax=Symphalangus syndactylus TaxID=9590 RepID=UPI00300556BC